MVIVLNSLSDMWLTCFIWIPSMAYSVLSFRINLAVSFFCSLSVSQKLCFSELRKSAISSLEHSEFMQRGPVVPFSAVSLCTRTWYTRKLSYVCCLHHVVVSESLFFSV